MDADLIVVGAGQSGLATAFAAERSGQKAIVLEASKSPGGSWPAYYESLKLFSPARFSSLPWQPFPGDQDRYPTRDETVAYLGACADDLQADIRFGCRVESVAIGPAGEFQVQAADGSQFRAPRLIAASGSFRSPHRPDLPGLKSFSGQILHASEYRAPQSVHGEQIVVVGGGNSAVQIAVELARSGRTVTLATRSPLRWFAQRPLGRDLHWWLSRTGLDAAPLGRWLGRTPPALDDGSYRAAIGENRPRHRPLFARLDGGGVLWPDGDREPVDAIVLATGYRPHLPYLSATAALDGEGLPIQSGGVSRTVAGLGYVGLELQRSIASATLRGVGRDAELVVRRMPRAEAAARRRRPPCCASPVHS